MTLRFLFLVSCSLSIAATSYSQMADRNAIWEKLTYINDTLRSASESELNSLLRIESSEKKMSATQDSVYAFLLSGIGHLFYEQGDYLQAVQYYHRAINLINVVIDKPYIKPGHLIMFYYRLSAIYDSLIRFPKR